MQDSPSSFLGFEMGVGDKSSSRGEGRRVVLLSSSTKFPGENLAGVPRTEVAKHNRNSLAKETDSSS